MTRVLKSKIPGPWLEDILKQSSNLVKLDGESDNSKAQKQSGDGFRAQTLSPVASKQQSCIHLSASDTSFLQGQRDLLQNLSHPPGPQGQSKRKGNKRAAFLPIAKLQLL
jgi:hypothetical protein